MGDHPILTGQGSRAMMKRTNKPIADDLRNGNLSAPRASKECRTIVKADDDRSLIAECLNGRKESFGQLLHRYQDRLYNTVLRLVENVEDAQDVVQEAFINAYQSLESFKGESQFFTWLYRIAMNAAINHQRKRRVVLSIDSGVNGELSIDPLDETAYGQPGVELEKREEEAQLLAALHRLSPDHRAVLILKDIDGEKYEVIAEIMGIPIGTVRSRLHRARIELRDLMEENAN